MSYLEWNHTKRIERILVAVNLLARTWKLRGKVFQTRSSLIAKNCGKWLRRNEWPRKIGKNLAYFFAKIHIFLAIFRQNS